MATVVIFDMDGVIVDSEPHTNRAAVALFHGLGHLDVVSADFIPFIGSGEDNYLLSVAILIMPRRR